MSAPSQAIVPVGRLAPSPTGLLHLGHARTFLLAWAHIRSRNGRLLMRIEDLDRERSKSHFTGALLEDLEWLGLDWDEAPVFQSERADLYRAALDKLHGKKLLYPCVCTRRELRNVAAAPHLEDVEPRYPGTCRARRLSGPIGTDNANLRFVVPSGSIEISDGIFGSETHDIARECGDFVVLRKDGVVAYQLAVVVDDADQGVTEVMRGADLLPSTARQWLLQDALGLPHPEWFHVPLVVDGEGHRLAKRRDDLSLRALRQAGIDPRLIVAWTARSAGFDASDRMTTSDLRSVFDLSRLSQNAPAEVFSALTVKH